MNSIGIVGAGHLGTVLARRLVAAGYAVRVATFRGRQSLQDFAQLTGTQAVDVAEVAVGVDVLILAIPLGQVRALPGAVIGSLRAGGIVVDAGNYVPPRDGSIPAIEDGLPETAWVSRALGVPVVKAFNNITDTSLDHGGRPEGARNRIALPVAGDDPQARAAVMRLVERLGFSAFDAGPLAGSWRQQIGQPAYCTDPTTDQLRRLLERADPDTVGRNRDGAMRLMARMPADYPKRDRVRAARFMAGLDRTRPASWLAVLRLGLAILRRGPGGAPPTTAGTGASRAAA